MTEYQNQLDLKFSALADPSRRHIVEQLAHGPLPVSRLAEPLTMRLQTVLQHIRVLERAGIVESSKQGRVRTCGLKTGELIEVHQWLRLVHLDWDSKLDRLSHQLSQDIENENKHHP